MKLTPEMLREAAEHLRNGASFACHALGRVVRRMDPHELDMYAVAERLLHPHLNAAGIPTDGSWMEGQFYGARKATLKALWMDALADRLEAGDA